jgi:F0F1-type ATP synthase membrane subunit b/b'
MKRFSRILLMGCAICAIFFAVDFGASVVRAEEDTNSNSKTQDTQEVFKWINFALVAGAGIWLFGKVLPPWFRGNAEKINSAIVKATAAKKEADELLREAENKLANLEKEVGELREKATRESAKEAERLRAVTKSDEEKIAVAAKSEIAAAERAARLELKALAAKLAVDGAAPLLAKQLTPQVQESLVSAFVKSLETRPN